MKKCRIGAPYLQDTIASRFYHSSARTEDAVLLIGGDHSNSTEWIPVDGSPAQPGPFTVRHGINHCTMQISDKTIVVTGGGDTKDLVTQYDLPTGKETPLTPLGQPRSGHACGLYQDLDGQQVSNMLFSCKLCGTDIDVLVHTGSFGHGGVGPWGWWLEH